MTPREAHLQYVVLSNASHNPVIVGVPGEIADLRSVTAMHKQQLWWPVLLVFWCLYKYRKITDDQAMVLQVHKQERMVSILPHRKSTQAERANYEKEFQAQSNSEHLLMFHTC
jgi:hypothetical protein